MEDSDCSDSCKRALSSPSGADSSPKRSRKDSRKVCLISWCPMGQDKNDYIIVIINLDSSEVGTQFRLEHDSLPPHRSLCVLGSTLYIFEGCKRNFDFDPDCPPTHVGGTAVYSVDLDSDSVKLEPCDVALHHPKVQPMSLPTPDGKKIMVFSNYIDNYGENCHFELYTPCEASEILPTMKIDGDFAEIVTRSGFVKDSLFLIQTDKSFYALDLDRLDRGWERSKYYRGLFYVNPTHDFFMTEDRFHFTPCGVYDIDHRCRGYWYALPVLEKLPDFLSATFAPLERDDGGYNFCVVRSCQFETVDRSYEPFAELRVDVLYAPTEKYKVEEAEGGTLNTRLVKSLRFKIHLDKPNHRFMASSLYSL